MAGARRVTGDYRSPHELDRGSILGGLLSHVTDMVVNGGCRSGCVNLIGI
jgi:hypothetical protein